MKKTPKNTYDIFVTDFNGKKYFDAKEWARFIQGLAEIMNIPEFSKLSKLITKQAGGNKK